MQKESLSEQLAAMTYEEVMQLPEGELARIMQEIKREGLQQMQTMDDPAYTAYTFEEKVGYWSYNMNQQMRWQAESGLDPYAGFSRDWYEAMQRIEPAFDAIMDAAFARFLAWEWDKAEYERRIQQPL